MRERDTEPTNRLRDPRDRRLPRIPDPCALVVFGVTGDLSRKKLIPAIYDLANRGLLPPGFTLLGFARRDFENQTTNRERIKEKKGMEKEKRTTRKKQKEHSKDKPKNKQEPITAKINGWYR